jgi:hypothetical protein
MIAVAVVRRLRRRRRSRIVITPIFFPTTAHIPFRFARVYEITPPRTFTARISRIARSQGVVRSIGVVVSTRRSSSRDDAVAVARFRTRFARAGAARSSHDFLLDSRAGERVGVVEDVGRVVDCRRPPMPERKI